MKINQRIRNLGGLIILKRTALNQTFSLRSCHSKYYDCHETYYPIVIVKADAGVPEHEDSIQIYREDPTVDIVR